MCSTIDDYVTLLANRRVRQLYKMVYEHSPHLRRKGTPFLNLIKNSGIESKGNNYLERGLDMCCCN